MISKKASKCVKSILERINDIEKICTKNGGVNFARIVWIYFSSFSKKRWICHSESAKQAKNPQIQGILP